MNQEQNNGNRDYYYSNTPSAAQSTQSPQQNPNFAQPNPNFAQPQNPNFATQQPNPNFYATSQPQANVEPPMSVKDWFITLLVFCIPCVNIIMLFVWAFGDSAGKKSRANFCKAYLIFYLIVMAIVFVMYIIMIAAGISVLSSLGDLESMYGAFLG